ncbi:DEAD/DEAH box helicase [Cupriavidus campinensis]|uniref:DEAD/DEAH box helicase family protein n=1 Tax=Cupriavidus campinensis TaxID=151783 RepID=A0AAE9HY59_9BURK|nr:DEAD/DEAH box helicase family protein [Cupriavidus campinensis]URF04008.1 DEAD/DEAH box helicase family protein [Cupriavidus campinensis]
MKVRLAAVYSVSKKIEKSWVRQLAWPEQEIDADVVRFVTDRAEGFEVTSHVLPMPVRIFKNAPPQMPASTEAAVLKLPNAAIVNDALDVSAGTWLQHPLLHPNDGPLGEANAKDAIDSWRDGFAYVKEDRSVGVIGFRPPQTGAVHAVHAHWTVSDEVASIVLPTGTGKTETMLGVLTSACCERVIVVVPTDALRTQIAHKFLTLGLLKAPGCKILAESARYPVVGVLEHKFETVEALTAFFEPCNVVVTTSQIVGQFPTRLQERISELCTHLFIDEAHHAEAPTWKRFKAHFGKRRILQFTATPFRDDDQLIDGKIIYRYPLRQAQNDGYFQPITFRSVFEFNDDKADVAIARATIQELENDQTGLHVAMARAQDIPRAKQVFEIYEGLGRYNPILLHSQLKVGERRDALARLMSGQSRIVVCVDMLGEGFDMPELKIAAFHDVRKSLPVTLQLAGRFTRSRSDLGSPTFIANVANVDVRDELQKLYSQDPDWNELLQELSDGQIDKQMEARSFLEGFEPFEGEIPLQEIRPATSMVVYRTRCSVWKPENYRKGLTGLSPTDKVRDTLNAKENTLVVVLGTSNFVPWTDIEAVKDWEWELLVAIWDKERDLLYIHGSSKSGEYRTMAKALCGDDVELIQDPELYRCFHGVKRLLLTNLGMNEQFGRQIRYIARMGADVAARLSEASKKTARRAVISGVGYENGAIATVGAAKRGRVWSFQRLRLDSFARWCKHVGSKVIDENIDPEAVLKGTLVPKLAKERPTAMPIAVDWPDSIYQESESVYSITLGDAKKTEFWNLGIDLVSPADTGDILFRVFSDSAEAVLRLEIAPIDGDSISTYRFVPVTPDGTFTKRLKTFPLSQFFDENPPVITFADGSYLEGNLLVMLPDIYAPYDRDRIEVWDWSDVNLKKEAQGVTCEPDSIQFKVIQELKGVGGYDVIYDDDGSGESADVVGIKVTEEQAGATIAVDFYHCKYSQESTAGARVGDLYEVCGQAQKSISWLLNQLRNTELFIHLLRRDPKLREGQELSRYRKGDRDILQTIRNRSRMASLKLRVFIVQPGLSRAKATPEQLSLLSVTENFLLETYSVPFGVIASA